MSSAWHPPKEDIPSVLSDRVYSMRRLNKMESQRLCSQLHYLNAEIAQSKSLISQKQTALRKELEQIRKVKDNPSVGLEKRKLLQQNSPRKSQTCRHDLSLETQVTQSRFRLLSTDQGHKQSSRLAPLNIRQRSKSTTSLPLPLGVEELSGALYAMNSVQKNQGNARRSQKKRSFSTGTQPQISELETGANAKPYGVTDNKVVDSEVLTDTKTRKWESCRHLDDYTQCDLERGGPQRLIPTDFRQKVHETGNNAPRKLIPARRVRSYSTNSTPIISERKVVASSGKTIIVPPQSVDASSQKPRCCSTSCVFKAIEEENLSVPLDDPLTSRKADLRSSTPIPLNRRERSLRANCSPVILERTGTTQIHSCLELNLKKELSESNQANMPGFETEERDLSKESVQNGAELPKTTNGYNDSHQPTSFDEIPGKEKN